MKTKRAREEEGKRQRERDRRQTKENEIEREMREMRMGKEKYNKMPRYTNRTNNDSEYET